MSSSDPASEDAVTPKELKGWYLFDWANSVFSTVVISGYLPLLLVGTSMSAAGFPAACQNIIRNQTQVKALFPDETVMFRILDQDENAGCSNSRCKGVYCYGEPEDPSECLDARGDKEIDLSVSFGFVDLHPTTYASTFISVSVLFQVDRGTWLVPAPITLLFTRSSGGRIHLAVRACRLWEPAQEHADRVLPRGLPLHHRMRRRYTTQSGPPAAAPLTPGHSDRRHLVAGRDPDGRVQHCLRCQHRVLQLLPAPPQRVPPRRPPRAQPGAKGGDARR